jgi:c-di-GMP-binding flagellar brake protein YcgR
MGIEHRRFQRIEDSSPINIALLNEKRLPDPDSWFSGTVLNISEGGVCFLCERDIEVGCHIWIDFLLGRGLGGRDYIEAVVENRWVQDSPARKSFIFGVKFKQLSQGDTEKLKRYLVHRQSQTETES